MILKEKDVWKEMLNKKEGYKLEQVIATTFTLNTDILPSILLKIIECDKNLESVQQLSREEKYILLSTYISNLDNKITDKLIVFSDDYLIPSHNRSTQFQKLVNEYCVPNFVVRISMKNGYFHPKIILVHYKNEKDEHYIKCAILSKNLTFSKNVVEIGSIIESTNKINKEEDVEIKNASDHIINLFKEICYCNKLKDVSELRGKTIPRGEAFKKIEKSLGAINNMKFRLCLEDDSVKPESAELLLGMPSSNLFAQCKDLKTDLRNALYWCSDSIDNKFLKKYECKHMISNLRSWKKLLVDKNSGKLLKKEDIPENYYITMDTSDSAFPIVVHAKFLESSHDGKRIVLLGSANYTCQGFSRNYECNLRLVYNEDEVTQFEYKQRRINNAFNIDKRKISIRQVKDEVVYEKLEEEDAKQKFEEKLQSMKWTIKIARNGLELNSSFEEFTDEEDKYIYNMEIFLTGKRFSLEVVEGREKNERKFWGICERYKSNMIPWYGYVNLVYFEAYNSPKVLPINVGLVWETEEITQKIRNGDGIIRILLEGRLFSLRNVIPAEPKGKKILYSSGDSVELRQAKYQAKGGKIKDIICNIDEILKYKSQVGIIDEEDEFSENTKNITEDMINHLKDRLENYKNMLEEQEKWNKESSDKE